MPDAPTVLHSLSTQCTTAAEVRHFFSLKGVKGTTAGYTTCPIAVWLRRETGDFWGVDTQAARKGVRDFLDEPIEEVELPLVLRDFMYNFDEGFYPDLVSEDDVFFWASRKSRGSNA